MQSVLRRDEHGRTALSDAAMTPHRVILHPTDEGWLVKRPGWPAEQFDSRDWAERAASSLAHEFHQRSGREACVVIDSGEGERLLHRFA